MQVKHSKYIIIGAGLSGLVTANVLLSKGVNDFVILEARDKVGGRIKTINGVDLGATWFQEQHVHIQKLLEDVRVNKFYQYAKGKSILVHNSMLPAHYFESNSNEPSANRIVGGSIALIDKLSEPILNKICLNVKVTDIIENKKGLLLKTDGKMFSAEKVVVTVPPKLAVELNFIPKLPNNLIDVMKQTHTWMSNAIKVGLVFKTAFWRDKKLSGTLMSQVSPVTELYDHCSNDEKKCVLMGFVNEELRHVAANIRKEYILNYLEKHLGEEIKDHINYYEKDWSKDRFTSSSNLEPLYVFPQYGNDAYAKSYMDGRLLFSGTETSPVYGGYLEGAIYSGKRTANTVMKV